MTVKYGNKKQRKNDILYLLVSIILIFAVLLSTFNFFYNSAEDEAFEMLHIQTKQIKDDLILQIKSDRENLVTMANFASKLYADGEGYDLMFNSFKPIGLFTGIGILNPDNTFVTKVGKLNLNGKISFKEEASRGAYISGRVADLTRDNEEIVRSAVPIKVNEQVVGILYGVIKLDTINAKYNAMANELDAQLFVYDKEFGDFIINTTQAVLGNISDLEDREYNNGYTYEELISTDKGYSSFKSKRNNENLYIHYSTIEDFDWGIMLARYENQVFQKTVVITTVISLMFFWIILIVTIYLLLVLRSERRENLITKKASEARKLLLEVNQQNENISIALKKIAEISKCSSSLFVDLEGENHFFSNEKFRNFSLSGEEKQYFISELFHYAIELRNSGRKGLGIINIRADSHLLKTNPSFYAFFKKNHLKLVTFASITNDSNGNASILGVVNPEDNYMARHLLEEIVVCFSIAIYNKNKLTKTYAAATTDALTDVLNRVAYKRDLPIFDEEKPEKFACLYIDVNELHLLNNKYGHAAGDEMLIHIANALKGTFFGHKVYRMGGDEFLVFTQNMDMETIKRSIDIFNSQLAVAGYHVAIGTSYRDKNYNTEEMVREAEVRMYEAKALYYQEKEQPSTNHEAGKYVQTKTGSIEIDTMLSVLSEYCTGVYNVSLDTDIARRILMPAYLGYKEKEENFSKLVADYIQKFVHPDYCRAIESFMNYEAIKSKLKNGEIPSISYTKITGEAMTLSVYSLSGNSKDINETLWIFAKK